MRFADIELSIDYSSNARTVQPEGRDCRDIWSGWLIGNGERTASKLATRRLPIRELAWVSRPF